MRESLATRSHIPTWITSENFLSQRAVWPLQAVAATAPAKPRTALSLIPQQRAFPGRRKYHCPTLHLAQDGGGRRALGGRHLFFVSLHGSKDDETKLAAGQVGRQAQHRRVPDLWGGFVLDATRGRTGGPGQSARPFIGFAGTEPRCTEPPRVRPGVAMLHCKRSSGAARL